MTDHEAAAAQAAAELIRGLAEAEPHPEGNPALAAAAGAMLARRLAVSHGSADGPGRRAALLLEILPDASAALEAARPHLAAAERERVARLILGCATCGEVHVPRQAVMRTAAGPVPYTNWAAEDGHVYKRRNMTPAELASVLNGEPAAPEPGQ